MKVKKLALILLFIPIISRAQDKLVDFGVGINPTKKTNVLSFSFAFNRTPSADAESGPYFWTAKNIFFKDTTDILALKPSAEANFGNVESSQNNFLFETGLDYSKILGRTTRIFAELVPAFNSNKNLDTSLYYGNLGIKFLYHNYPSKIPFYIVPSLNFHSGQRIESSSKNLFYRIVPSVKTSAKFFKKKLTFSVEAKTFFIFNDSEIPNGSYALLNTSINFMINKSIGISAKYVNGYDQPIFKKIEAITLGFSIYR